MTTTSLLTDPEESSSTSQETENLLSHGGDNRAIAERSLRRKIADWLSNAPFIGAWRAYMQQTVVLPGVALALLYFTVLR